jgi:proton-translocating NADH-quinone oxidoreductase chain L
MDWFIQTLWLVPIYPLVAFLLISLGRALPKPLAYDASEGHGHLDAAEPLPFLAKKEVAFALTSGATLLGLVHAIASIGWLFNQTPGFVNPIEQNWQWLQAGDLVLKLGTLLDANTVMMLFVVTFISLFIQIYTHGYMNHDKGYAKFFGYLALFNFSMLGLVLSSNLIQTYMFWELVGVSSYLLIGFWFHKPAAAAASMKAFLVNRVGDFGFLLGILLLLGTTFSSGFWQQYLSINPEQALMSFQGFMPMVGSLVNNIPAWLLGVIGILVFMGPMAKSAQVPLHTWLPDAMEGPTPISALIHAATMVAAGVYLIARVFPLVAASTDITMPFITFIGVITAIVGATIALTQTDIKKALAYSTMSQLGFMVAAMGLGAYTAGLFHLFTHAFFKAMLFLGSGSVIHACEGEQDMRKMGGLLKKLPVTGITYLIGTIAISGLFWTSGFWSKDEILAAAAHQHPVVYGLLSATAGLTAFYMFRTFFMTFMGTYRGDAHVHKEDRVMTTPLAVLAVPSLLIGILLSGFAFGLPAFSDYITHGLMASTEHHPHSLLEAMFNKVGNASQMVGLTGLVLAFVVYGIKLVNTDAVKKVFAWPYALFRNKWFFDDVYQGLVEGGFLLIAQASATFDKLVIDGVVNGVGCLTAGTGTLLRRLQTGRIQTYVTVLGLSVLALVVTYQVLMVKG